jgi:hypothetical protein
MDENSTTEYTDYLVALINWHARGCPVPESLEVRRERWRREAQERLNARGLPRRSA